MTFNHDCLLNGIAEGTQRTVSLEIVVSSFEYILTSAIRNDYAPHSQRKNLAHLVFL